MKKVHKNQKDEGHYCEANRESENWTNVMWGNAAYICYEDNDGRLIVTNTEYANSVSFCPFCGEKSKKPLE